MAAVDGVLGHIYTYGIESDDNGTFQLDTMRNSWLEKDCFEDLGIHITSFSIYHQWHYASLPHQH
jgi:hypothetical protein